MAIKIADSALKRRVGRVSGNTVIFLGLVLLQQSHPKVRTGRLDEKIFDI